jgi:hypothetical protein
VSNPSMRIHPDVLAAVRRYVEETGNRNSNDVSEHVRTLMEARAVSGDPLADALCERCEREGWRIYVKPAIDVLEEQTLVYVDNTGKVVGMPASAGVRERDVTTGEETGRWVRVPLIRGRTWDQFEEMMAERLRQHSILHDQILAFQEIWRLRVRYPESAGPQEACDMAGLDWREINLSALN